MPQISLRYLPKAILASIDRPFFIWIAPPLLCLSGVLGVLFAAIAMWSDNQLVRVDVGISSLALPTMFALAILNAGVNFASAYAFAREKPWTRTLFVGGSAAFVVFVTTAAVLEGSSWQLALAGVAWPLFLIAVESWYLYGYGPVRRYYQHLASESAR